MYKNLDIVTPSINHRLRHRCFSMERGIVSARRFSPPLLLVFVTLSKNKYVHYRYLVGTGT